MRFAKESLPFVLPFAVASGLSFLRGRGRLGGALATAGVGVLLFFRDPERYYGGDAATVLAPADGLVTKIDTLDDPAVSPEPMKRIVTFLSVFDVHVQRVPADGRVVASGLTRGRKVAAFREDADEVNESYLTVIERPDGDRLGVRQIAGLLARRVVCYLHPGQAVQRGQHLGLIKFGSRVDLLVPQSYEILVERGDRLQNGQTPVARPASS